MVGEQERDDETERKLRRLEPRPAELPPLVERVEAEPHVGQERGVEQERAGKRLPDELLESEPALHRRDRDVAKRVVEEVKRHIGEEDEARGQPKAADVERRAH